MKRLSRVLTVTLLIVLLTAGSISAALPPQHQYYLVCSASKRATDTDTNLLPNPEPKGNSTVNPNSLTAAENCCINGERLSRVPNLPLITS